MRFSNGSPNDRWGQLAVACGVALLAFTWWPGEQQSLLRGDSGIFVYMGQQLAEGRRLYLDVWDHKPPLIYWWNALGAWIAPRSPLGVWAIACAHIAAAAILLWRLLAKRTGQAAAALGTILFLRALFTQLDQPNYTETYALPWQVLLVGCGWAAALGEGSIKSAALAGIAGVLAAATRPNNAGAALFFVACLLAAPGPKRAWWGAWAAGSALCALLLASPFLAASSFSEMWHAAVAFNLTYAGQQSLAQKLAAAWQGCLQLSLSALLPLALAGAFLLWRSAHPLRILLPAWLAFEIWLAALSGRSYEHYFAMACVAAACVVGVGLSSTVERRVLWALTLSFTSVFALQCLSTLRTRWKEPLDRETRISRKLLSLVGPNDSYFYWGTGPRNLWYVLHRPPPVALFHTTPLLANNGQYRALVPGLLRDLLGQTPQWIIEDTSEKEGLAPGPWDTEESAELKRKLLRNYEAIDSSGSERFWKRRSWQ